jgi:ribosomal-protein-alanine N-acetyltransferase
MNWFRIRRAQLRDKEAMHRVERACFVIPWSEDELARDATENILAVYYVAETMARFSLAENAEDGFPSQSGRTVATPELALVGYAGVWVVLDEGHITNVAVDPDYRRQGIAAMLLTQLLKAACEKGARRFTLEVKSTNEAAITLYERFGFRAAGRRRGYYREDGEDAIIMWTDYNNE